MEASKFVQILQVEDYRMESGSVAVPASRGSVRAHNSVRIWLLGRPVGRSRVTQAFLEARSDWAEPPLPRFDFTPPRIFIGYTPATIAPVVSMLLDGIQLYCQYRELTNGTVHADVHLPRRNLGPGEDPHWTPAG